MATAGFAAAHPQRNVSGPHGQRQVLNELACSWLAVLADTACGPIERPLHQVSELSGIVFNYVVRSENRVDEVLDEAQRAGGKILKPAANLRWAVTADPSPTRMATSGTSPTAPKEKTSPTPSNEVSALPQ
jgi:hypothetical protein